MRGLNLLKNTVQKVMNFSNDRTENKNDQINNLIKDITLRNSSIDTILNIISEKHSNIEESQKKLYSQEQELQIREEKINNLIKKENDLEELKHKYTILNGKYRSLQYQLNQDLQTKQIKNKKVKILLFGDFISNDEHIKSMINSFIKEDGVKPSIEIINKYNIKKSTIIEKLKTGNYKYCIYGPTPHSIKGKNSKTSFISWAKDNNIDTIFRGSNNRSISKSKLTHIIRSIAA